jgi:hypothetical protein
MHNELALINHQHENQRLHQVDLVEGFKQRNILLPIAEARVMEHLIGHSMMQYRSPLPQGHSNMYDFDEFYRAHYSDFQNWHHMKGQILFVETYFIYLIVYYVYKDFHCLKNNGILYIEIENKTSKTYLELQFVRRIFI